VGNGRGGTARSIVLSARRLGSGVALAGLVLATTLSACSGDDSDGSTTTRGGDAATTMATPSTAPALRTCAEDPHAVVFDVGSLTFGTAELARWLGDPTYDMPLRPGTTDLLAAYQARGYQIVYMTALAADSVMDSTGAPVSGEITAWQARHGMPTGEGTRLVMWDTANFTDPTAFRIDVLVQLSLQGLSLDYGYTDDEHDVRAMSNGGIPDDRIFTVQGVGGTPGTVGTLEQDWASHKARVVDPLPPACTP
jgi:hypothetical protein